MDRRTFLKVGVVGAVAVSLPARAYEPTRYPHPDLVTLNPDFNGFLGSTPIQRLYTDPNMLWAEGPACASNALAAADVQGVHRRVRR